MPISPATIPATRWFSVALGLALALGVARPSRADLSFNFNDGNDNGLTRYDPLAPFGSGSTFSFPSLGHLNDGYQLTSGPSASVSNLGPSRVGAYSATETFTNFRESVDILNYDSANPQALGLLARGNNVGLGTSNAYFLQYNLADFPKGQDGLIITRIDGEQPSANSQEVAFASVDPKVGVRLVFTGVGSTLTGQVFALNDLHDALATVTFIDSTYSSGFSGLLAANYNNGLNSGVAATFDNLIVQSVPEPSSMILMALGVAFLGGFGLRKRGRTAGVTA